MVWRLIRPRYFTVLCSWRLAVGVVGSHSHRAVVTMDTCRYLGGEGHYKHALLFENSFRCYFDCIFIVPLPLPLPTRTNVNTPTHHKHHCKMWCQIAGNITIYPFFISQPKSIIARRHTLARLTIIIYVISLIKVLNNHQKILHQVMTFYEELSVSIILKHVSERQYHLRIEYTYISTSLFIFHIIKRILHSQQLSWYVFLVSYSNIRSRIVVLWKYRVSRRLSLRALHDIPHKEQDATVVRTSRLQSEAAWKSYTFVCMGIYIYIEPRLECYRNA